ncbi:MAG: FAD-dependent oxidoreductase, partial [Bradymonadaceae bacterium]
MTDETYDAIIIGTGQAGPSLADQLGEIDASVAIIERDRVGGTCVNYGCTPTKTMVASARNAHMARRGGDYGVDTGGEVSVDMSAVHERMREVAGGSNKGVTSWLEGLEHVDLLRGHAQFTGPNTVDVGGRTLEADRLFINVGARPRVPDIEGLEDVDYMTNREILELQKAPEHLVVIGGSYIGLEFGQMFRRFGSEVTIVEQGPRLIG